MIKTELCALSVANDLVTKWHRHHSKVVGHRFSICAKNAEGELIGAAIIGRPVARAYDSTQIVEVTRLVTNGTRNACSALYAAAAREAKKRGFKHIITYILESEPGTSLKAVAWTQEAFVKGRTWSCKSRPRVDKSPCQTMNKTRWGKDL